MVAGGGAAGSRGGAGAGASGAAGSRGAGAAPAGGGRGGGGGAAGGPRRLSVQEAARGEQDDPLPLDDRGEALEGGARRQRRVEERARVLERAKDVAVADGVIPEAFGAQEIDEAGDADRVDGRRQRRMQQPREEELELVDLRGRRGRVGGIARRIAPRRHAHPFVIKNPEFHRIVGNSLLKLADFFSDLFESLKFHFFFGKTK